MADWEYSVNDPEKSEDSNNQTTCIHPLLPGVPINQIKNRFLSIINCEP